MHFCPAWKPISLLLKLTNFHVPFASLTAPEISEPCGLDTEVEIPPFHATMVATEPSIFLYSNSVRTVWEGLIGVVDRFVTPSRAARRPLWSSTAFRASVANSGDSSDPDCTKLRPRNPGATRSTG